jgi:hypothetical protein
MDDEFAASPSPVELSEAPRSEFGRDFLACIAHHMGLGRDPDGGPGH